MYNKPMPDIPEVEAGKVSGVSYPVSYAQQTTMGTAAPYISVTYVTDVYTEYTTYCPEATAIPYNGKTYTITEPGYLTITDCPCTVVKSYSLTNGVNPYYNAANMTVAPAKPTKYPAAVYTAGASFDRASAVLSLGIAGVLAVVAML
jgi:hypothetical protein